MLTPLTHGNLKSLYFHNLSFESIWGAYRHPTWLLMCSYTVGNITMMPDIFHVFLSMCVCMATVCGSDVWMKINERLCIVAFV